MVTKKLFGASIGVFLLVLLSGCMGDDGSVYIGFAWYNDIAYFSAGHSGLPSWINNYNYDGSTYGTSEGSYTTRWRISGDSFVQEARYSIEADEGGLFWNDGEDKTFVLHMYTLGHNIEEKGLSDEEINTSVISTLRKDDDFAEYERKVVSRYVERVGRYRVSVTIYELREP